MLSQYLRWDILTLDVLGAKVSLYGGQSELEGKGLDKV
jgi:hypothetical protein